MELLIGLAPIFLLVLVAAVLIAPGMRTPPNGSKNSEKYSVGSSGDAGGDGGGD